MPRIRTIKPEFWSSPSVAGADPWVRLLFIAMWNWADDWGRGTANAKELAAFAFPHDEDPDAPTAAELPSLLTEVRGRFGVVFYEVSGRRFYAIPSWERHQRNERRAKSRFPPPEDGSDFDPWPPRGTSDTDTRKFRDSAAEVSARSTEGVRRSPHSAEQANHPSSQTAAAEDGPNGSRNTPEMPLDLGVSELPTHKHGTSVQVDGSSGTGTGEPGNRGTEEQDKDLADAPRRPPSTTSPPGFDEFWTNYPRKTAKAEARKAWPAATRRLEPDRLVKAAAYWARLWADTETPKAFIPHPATWLRGDRWDDEPPPRRTNSPNPPAAQTGTGSPRVDKAMGFLVPDDPFLTQLHGEPPNLTIIEGGQTA